MHPLRLQLVALCHEYILYRYLYLYLRCSAHHVDLADISARREQDARREQGDATFSIVRWCTT